MKTLKKTKNVLLVTVLSLILLIAIIFGGLYIYGAVQKKSAIHEVEKMINEPKK